MNKWWQNCISGWTIPSYNVCILYWILKVSNYFFQTVNLRSPRLIYFIIMWFLLFQDPTAAVRVRHSLLVLLVHEGSRSNIRTDFMHILAQLISSKAALFFISGENSGWVSISVLLIISFAFELYYGCSVRHSFIHHSWWRDRAFRDSADWSTLKHGFRSVQILRRACILMQLWLCCCTGSAHSLAS